MTYNVFGGTLNLTQLRYCAITTDIVDINDQYRRELQVVR